MKELLVVALLMSSLTNLSEFQLITPSIITLPEDTITWDYVNILLIEEEKGITPRNIGNSNGTNEGVGVITSSTSGEDRVHANSFNGLGIKCNKFGKQRNISKRCSAFMKGRNRTNRRDHNQTRQERAENHQRNITACFEKKDKVSLLSIARLNVARINEKPCLAIDSGVTEHAVNNLSYFADCRKVKVIQLTIAKV